MGETSIQWTDHSINPIRARLRDAAHAGVTKGGYDSGVGHYCERVSPGCALCYSGTTQKRFGMPTFPGVLKGEPPVDVFFDDERLREVLRRTKPTKYFWCDMTDLFGRWVPDEWIDKCLAVMALTPHHTHQVLTKRIDRAAVYLGRVGRSIEFLERPARDLGYTLKFEGIGLSRWPLPNLWVGVSVEDQRRADERIPHLLRCPAAVRFLSCEPLLGAVDLARHIGDRECFNCGKQFIEAAAGPRPCPHCYAESDSDIYGVRAGIHWVIAGGESGPGARPCDVEWVRTIVRQCKAAGVPAFVKQMGAGLRMSFAEWNENWQELSDKWGFTADGPNCNDGIWRGRDKKGGNPEEWAADLRVREMPSPAARPEAAR